MAERDVIVAGPRPRAPRPPGALIRLLVLAETVALAVAVAVAVHYHAGLSARAALSARAGAPGSLPLADVTTVVLPLPADGTVRGTVVITTAALPGAGRGQFTVSAIITGALPGTFYDLIGNGPLRGIMARGSVCDALRWPESNP